MIELVRNSGSLRTRETTDLDNPEILYALAYSYYDHGNYEHAGELFDRLVGHDPMEKKYLLGLAACHKMRADYKTAVKIYNGRLLRECDDPRVHLHRAECLIALKDYDQAAKALAEAHQRIAWDECHQPLADRVLALLRLVASG
jgi:type III secretion system low calcium response chaperone LcrH/SycD